MHGQTEVKITGPIVVHERDMAQIPETRTDGSATALKVTDRTTIRCEKGFLQGGTVMDASALNAGAGR